MGEGNGTGSETSGSAGKRMGDSRGTADSGGQDPQEALLLMIHILCILSLSFIVIILPLRFLIAMAADTCSFLFLEPAMLTTYLHVINLPCANS